MSTFTAILSQRYHFAYFKTIFCYVYSATFERQTYVLLLYIYFITLVTGYCADSDHEEKSDSDTREV